MLPPLLPPLPDLLDEPLPPLLPELPVLVDLRELETPPSPEHVEVAIPPGTQMGMGDGTMLHFPTGGTMRHAPGCTACNDTGKDPDGTACSFCEIVNLRVPASVAQVIQYAPELAAAIVQDAHKALEWMLPAADEPPSHVTPWFHPDDAPVRDGCYEVQIRFGEVVKLEWNCAKQLWFYPSAEMCCEHGSLHIIAFGWRGLTYEAYQNEQAKV